MTKRLIDEGLTNYVVLFQNTGKESLETLDFINECDKRWNLNVVWLEYRSRNGYDIVTYETASRKGEPFEMLVDKFGYLPNTVSRICTAQLKIRTIHRYVRSLGIEHTENSDWMGIRADEPRRAAKVEKDRVPLYTAGITAQDVGKFWSEHSFDLELPNMNGKTMHGNCDLCFLKGYQQIVSLVKEKPERAVWWANMESKMDNIITSGDGNRFRKDRMSYASLMEYTQDQTDMFDDETIPCFCGD
jgi:3'-phosphoadenosine 5'-phosphosulfate sulfotransferase (PAPS reductase)/FAD synthetase